MDLNKLSGTVCTGIHQAVLKSVAGSSEHSNENIGSINGEKFLKHLISYQILRKDSATWN
jgi:hypothetical protein